MDSRRKPSWFFQTGTKVQLQDPFEVEFQMSNLVIKIGNRNSMDIFMCKCSCLWIYNTT